MSVEVEETSTFKPWPRGKWSDMRPQRRRVLAKAFYQRDPWIVARELLGKLLVRRQGSRRLSCMITETEAYYGREDPSSRAARGGDLANRMYGEPGLAMIYGIHRQWLLNIVAHDVGEGGAVLLRSCMPVEGVEAMRVNRGVNDDRLLTTGPGRLTRALGIDKGLHGMPVYIRGGGLWVEDYRDFMDSDVVLSWRVGVSADLFFPNRFYVRGCGFVSRG